MTCTIERNYQHRTYLHPAREGWLDKMVTLVDKL